MKTNKFTTTLILNVLIFGTAFANNAGVNAQESTFDGYTWIFNHLLLIVSGIIILGVLISFFKLSFDFLKLEKNRQLIELGLLTQEDLDRERPSFWQNMYKKAWALVPVQEESTIDLGHSYDGIRELDNKLPPWWLGLFYGTILFAFIYMYQYQWSNSGWSSIGDYEQEMEAGEQAKKEYLSKMANLVTEQNVVQLLDPADIAIGKNIFEAKNCKTCHGEQGQGNGVGPNLTDEYWIHGGGIKNVFKTIKYGVPEKGMISWRDQIKPAEMQKLASFVLSLQGSNPPDAKEKKGTLYVEETAEN